MALAIPLGLLIGLSLGALGGGGSILTVPALVYLLGQSPHAATTGSLLVVGISALAGTVAHYRAGRVRVGPGVVFGVLGVAGSYAGTRLSARVDPHLLLTAFAGLMIVAAVAMSRRRADTDDIGRQELDVSPRAGIESRPAAGTSGSVAVLAEPVPPLRDVGGAGIARPSGAGIARLGGAGIARLLAAATVVGLLTGFFGVGGGFVIVPALVLALSFPMPAAVGTSLLVIAINSATALAARVGGHVHLDWPLLAAFTAAAIAGSFVGNRVASRVHPARLTRAFVVLLIAVAAYTAARSIPHLL